MLGLASKISAAGPLRQALDWGAFPSWSRVRDAGGTAKMRADWAFVSGVSLVSPDLESNRQNTGKGTAGH